MMRQRITRLIAQQQNTAIVHLISGAVMISFSGVWDVLFFQRPTSGLNWTGVIIAITAIYLGTIQNSDSR